MRIPTATYRVQLHLNFRFTDAEQLVPYLHGMGISHLYASPRGQARKGSLHGYDVADPLRINSELGTEEEFARLVDRLHKYGMGLLLDIVPNHMAASSENPWWMDVLENGRDSAYASFFDIDWDAPGAKSPELERNQVVLPVLTDLYDRVLENQKITLRFDERGFYIQAESNCVPINPATYASILGQTLEVLRTSAPSDSETTEKLEQLLAIAIGLENSPGPASGFQKLKSATRAGLKDRLWHLALESEAVRSAVEVTLREFNGTQGDLESFRKLDTLLRSQSYRLAHWRTAAEEINYRRFFGLNDLVAIRVEDPLVFEATHALTLRLVAENKVNGLRIDHIDGLHDPLEYLQRLQVARKKEPDDESDSLNLYTVVEKITSGTETLPADWPTAGTTGYDFLNAVNTLLIDPNGWRQLEAVYREFTGIRSSFSDTWYVRKKQVMEELFGSDIQVLASRLGRLAVLDPRGRDLPLRELVRGLKEITARLPIYRTYLRDLVLSDQDRRYLAQAIEQARLPASNGVAKALLSFFRRVFLLDPPDGPVDYRDVWLDFLMRWQQFSGAVMAKGMEDTAFFVHHGLLSLNEVGCNPSRKDIRFGVSPFHDFNRRAFKDHRFTLNATSTHDTKWSEDARVRINVLSEFPREWRQRLSRWSEMNRQSKTQVDGRWVPSPNDEVLLYQALLGLWPLEQPNLVEIKERMETFLIKAVREAKTHSSWISPSESYEDGIRKFTSAILRESPENAFVPDFAAFVEEISTFAACNAYAQVLLKIASPGVPDFYQGNGLWQFRLTDPDNRNVVDFRQRIEILEGLSTPKESNGCTACDLLKTWRDGRLKLYLAKQALNFRQAHKDLFLEGDYISLKVTGEKKDSVCAFARRLNHSWAIVVAPRLVARLCPPGTFPLGGAAWKNTAIQLPSRAPAQWNGPFTGDNFTASGNSIPLAQAFARLPFALLTHVEPIQE
jgi:(1->4)-alpha-D-glucan 1-alpha-D-glucosylmutase